MKLVTKVLVLFVIFATLLAVGCVGSADEETSDNYEESLSGSADEESSLQVEENSPQSNTSTYQDEEWIASAKNQSKIIRTDFAGISSARESFDADVLGKWGQNLVNDTREAKEENDNYTVSSTLQDAQKQWVLALQDYNKAGKFIVTGADAYKNGHIISATNDFRKAATFVKTGTESAKLAAAYVEP